MQKRKLIEVALPLEAINRESAREKEPFTRNHPRGLHIWWARRPLTAARAILFGQLVDDPSSHPDRFPGEEKQRAERERLHRIMERLIVWENSHNMEVLREARSEILSSCDGNPPPIFDPFAGGGTIPLEAQRLGLDARASDLNPVAVLINKSLIEIPPKFRDQPSVFLGADERRTLMWPGASGLREDIRSYGEWLRVEAEKRIGSIYPPAILADGSAVPVAAWIWARTVTCPNPACNIEMPLVATWWLSKKKGKEAYVEPEVVHDASHASGKRVDFIVRRGLPDLQSRTKAGTVGRAGATCIACESAVELKYVRAQGVAKRLGASLMAVVGQGNRKREYLAATIEHRAAAKLDKPADLPDALLPLQALSFRVQAYGMERWADLFTNRQLVAIVTLTDLVRELRDHVLRDAVAAGLPRSATLEEGGTGADAYADAITTYLGLAVSRYADLSNSLCSWNQTNENVRALFSRQAIPMVWDFAEANVLGPVGIAGPIESAASAVHAGFSGPGRASQGDAQRADYDGVLVSTDPPYYDNIGYSDLSDFFYVWQRRALRTVHPRLYQTVLVPKAEELVANPYRHEGGRSEARTFFEEGFRDVFSRARKCANPNYPITVYYAFKQAESTAIGESSSGWETLLDGMIGSGWSITATWPIRSERVARSVGLGTNALASSIVLALRPRPEDAPTTDRRGLISALREELPAALRGLQQGAIAPVDLPQAAIGPGMAVFSRYATVVEADGSTMAVRAALARINEILDEVLAEQEGDFDDPTRFAIAWYRQHGYGTGTFGDADNLARARNTAVDLMERHGVLTSRAGKVGLIRPADLPAEYDPAKDLYISDWEALHHIIRTLESDGISAAAGVLASASSRPDGAVDADLVKELAFLLFSIAEKKSWTKDALSFNALAQSWSDIMAASQDHGEARSPQAAFDFDEDGEF